MATVSPSVAVQEHEEANLASAVRCTNVGVSPHAARFPSSSVLRLVRQPSHTKSVRVDVLGRAGLDAADVSAESRASRWYPNCLGLLLLLPPKSLPSQAFLPKLVIEQMVVVAPRTIRGSFCSVWPIGWAR